jgi:hypothetical protein
LLWLTIASIIYGVVASLDPILFIFIGYTLNASGMYLGVLSAFWSIAYIAVSRILNGFADEGKNKLLLMFALISLSASYICLGTMNYITAMLSYIMHAIAFASMNLAISVTMLENSDSDSWSRVSIIQRSLSNVSRGFILVLLAMWREVSIGYLFVLSILLNIVSILILPSITWSFERKFYRLNRNINEIGMYIKASSSVLFLDKPSIAHYIYTISWGKEARVSIYRILIAITTATAIGDYIFTVLPIILKSYMTIYSLWIAYGIASIFSAFITITLGIPSINRNIFAIAMAIARTCLLVFGLTFIRESLTLAIYIALSSLLYMFIDITLYNMFVENSAGFSTANYFIFREIGSIIGSLIGGLVLGFGTYPFLLVALVIGFSAVVVLI